MEAGIAIIDTFLYGGKKYLDQREYAETIQELKGRDESTIPEGFIVYVKETGSRYEFNSNNPISPDTGKWRELETGGGAPSIIDGGTF